MLIRSPAVERSNEFLGLGLEFRALLEDGHEVFGLLDLVDKLRPFADKSECCVTDLPLPFANLGDRLNVKHLLAEHASVAVAGVLPSAPRTFDGCNRVGFLKLNVLPVKLGNLPVGVLAEDTDVARGDAAPLGPPEAFLDGRFVHSAGGEVRRLGLPEVREGNGLVDTGTFGGRLDGLPKELVGDTLRAVELRPQRCVTTVRVGVLTEPAVQVGHARDEQDGPLAGLTVEGEFQAVAAVRDIADSQVGEFPTAGTGVPRDGDERGIPGVPGRFDHRFHVVLPVEHIRRIRGRVVVAARRRRDSLQGFGYLVAVSDALAERAEGEPVVLVRLLVVVPAVDPPEHVLGGVRAFEGRGEFRVWESLVTYTASLAGHDGTVTEELLMALVAVLGFEQVKTVAEGEKVLAVPFGDAIRILNLATEKFDLPARIVRHSLLAITYTWALNSWFKSRLGRLYFLNI